MSDAVEKITAELQALGNAGIAQQSQRFFKTAKGEYGEGDVFLGIRVPVLRTFARKCRDTGLDDTLVLLQSPLHEARLLALFVLIARYRRADVAEQKSMYRSYL